MRFRLMHVDEMLHVAASDGILEECQCRAVESMDVYFDSVEFEQAKEQLMVWKTDMPCESKDFQWLDGKTASQVRW